MCVCGGGDSGSVSRGCVATCSHVSVLYCYVLRGCVDRAVLRGCVCCYLQPKHTR